MEFLRPLRSNMLRYQFCRSLIVQLHFSRKTNESFTKLLFQTQIYSARSFFKYIITLENILHIFRIAMKIRNYWKNPERFRFNPRNFMCITHIRNCANFRFSYTISHARNDYITNSSFSVFSGTINELTSYKFEVKNLQKRDIWERYSDNAIFNNTYINSST